MKHKIELIKELSTDNLFSKDWILTNLFLDKVSIRKFKIKSIFKNDIE